MMTENNLHSAERYLQDSLSKRILLLDGAMGTMIMREQLNEADFRGSRFKDHVHNLSGCNDVLCLTRPDVIKSIHTQYLEAGSDIIETNSFNCHVYSLGDYGLEDEAYEIAFAAATLAREAVDSFDDKGRRRLVAGSMGPTSKSLTIASLTGDGSANWDTMTASYESTATALLKGGVDLLLIETVFDALNAKSAITGARRAMEKTGRTVPIIISATLTEAGRLLSGITLDAFVTAVGHANPVAITLNCGFGVDGMTTALESMQKFPYYIGIYPNAGLPDETGQYTETAITMASKVEPLLKGGKLNIVGGCCGTTPEHIKALSELLHTEYPANYKLRQLSSVDNQDSKVELPVDTAFIKVGERCNVAGSRKFLRLIKEKKVAEALDIAAQQLEAGAAIIDINLDDAMLDSQKEMEEFLRAFLSDTRLADVPLMIDSADWNTLKKAMRMLQGRAIINSISLKEGEDTFIAHAREIKDMGAIPVVMAFDEEGQATTVDRRKEIFKRSFSILTSNKVGFKPSEIIFDPNILAVCTGIEEHDTLAKDFVESVKWIKDTFKGVKVSGGVSNLSFAFRGNNVVREAMHAVFLQHAIKGGMDMAIVNPSTLMRPDDIEPLLREAVEVALFLEPGVEATARLIDVASDISRREEAKKQMKAGIHVAEKQVVSNEEDATALLEKKIIKADGEGLEALILKCRERGMTAMEIVEGPLMQAMDEIGRRFGQGQLFLPQVVKSAGIMRKAVEILTPFMESESAADSSNTRRKLILATVKGDVHDIGKNIVNVIMRCNGWEVIDLGVMVEPEVILDAIDRHNPDAVGLSGLITPSLNEMSRMAALLEEKGYTLPLFVGGATTSELHTALKIAPLYGHGVVVHTADAASLPPVASNVTGKDASGYKSHIKENQESLVKNYLEKEQGSSRLSLEEARNRRMIVSVPSPRPLTASTTFTMTVKDVMPFINWRAFLDTWKLPPALAALADVTGCDHCRAQWLASVDSNEKKQATEAMQLIKEARRVSEELQRIGAVIKARVEILPSTCADETIIVHTPKGDEVAIATPRQTTLQPDGRPNLALSDFLYDGGDFIGFFAVTTAGIISEQIEKYKNNADEYRAMLLQSLADRLAEAATEVMHHRVRSSLWGYAPLEKLSPDEFMKRNFRGIRPAVGYPSLPDQRVIFQLDKILDYASLGIGLTENGAMMPQASTTGLLFASWEARYFAV